MRRDFCAQPGSRSVPARARGEAARCRRTHTGRPARRSGGRVPSAIALIPARAGSERVKDKNIRPLAGHPLLAYAITSARQAGLFDRVVCSTDSGKIAEVAQRYGADVPFLRPSELATTTSPDIDWLKYTLEQ